MTVVLHDQYAYIYVTALDVEMLAEAEGDWERQRILMLLARNVPRMEVGFEEINRNLRTDEAGASFLSGLNQWSEKVLSNGRRALDAGGYGL